MCAITRPRRPTVIAGVRSSTMPESNTIAASAPRSSARIHSAMLSLPASSSPSTTTRTLTGSSPALGEAAGRRQQRPEVALVVAGAAGVEAPVAHLGLERRRRPRAQVARALDVVVAVDEDGRRVGAARRAGRRRRAGCRRRSGRAPRCRRARSTWPAAHSAARRRSAGSPPPVEIDGMRSHSTS